MEQPLSEAEAAQREREGRWVLGCSVGCLVPFLVFLFVGGWFFNEISGPVDGSADFIELRASKIKGGKYALVHYDVWYGRDGHTSGFTIRKNLANFNFREGPKLPSLDFRKIGPDTIVSVSVTREPNKPLELTPYKTTTFRYGEATILHEKYWQEYAHESCTWRKYRFESVVEKEDSVIFHNNFSSETDTLIRRLAFPKGNIHLQTDGGVTNIVVNKFIREYQDVPEWKDGAYTGDTIRYRPVVCFQRYDFIPIDKVHRNDLSDYGIFKPYPVIRTDK